MADKAAANRSLNTIRTELQYLHNSGIVNPAQFQSIMAQLPQNDGVPSQYIDPRYAPNQNYAPPVQQIAQAAQDPNHPANPNHPKHGQWAAKLGSKLGNAAIFGAGATAGADLVNSIF
ncbi:protein that induces appearance of [PIN+] prion when overproduced [Lecanora helva]